MRQFGEPDVHPIVKGLPDAPHVLQVTKEAGAPTKFGETVCALVLCVCHYASLCHTVREEMGEREGLCVWWSLWCWCVMVAVVACVCVCV